MTKGKKILIISAVLIILAGIFFLSKKLRLILGMGVNYDFNTLNKNVELKLSSYGTKSSRSLSVSENGTLLGMIIRQPSGIVFINTSGTSIPVSNEKDLKLLDSIL